ncbi:hypothetical protein [Runella sp.]|uniref:hypothetical protein n=1 Tax=Runella sp. TaxID=1960881 RepID=UPI003D12277D
MKNLFFAFWLISSVCFGQITIVDSVGNTYTIPKGTYKKVTDAKPTIPIVLKNCGCTTADFSIVSILKKEGALYEVNFDACGVNPLRWEVGTKADTFAPTSGTFIADLTGLLPGEYNFKITSTGCIGKAEKKFTIASVGAIPVLGNYNLTALSDPLGATSLQTGNYELRYIESRPDEHLNLIIEQSGNDILLTDTGNSLQSVSITLNGWTDLENSGRLEKEPVLPYTLYHVSKWSVARPTLREFWMAMYSTPKAEFRRSELFFYIVPKGETWNPVGQSYNPIGRPKVFSDLPAFTLKNRVYGFEYDLLDETDARKKELSIQFNWLPGKKHLKLYASALGSFLRKLPTRKGFEELTEKECIDFANTLPIEQIVAFDIEPGAGENWIIDYDGANFTRNMGIVIDRLKERGALAYNWLDVPDKSPNVISLDGMKFGTGGNYGKDITKFGEMYKRIGDVQRRNNPYSLISTGYGYAGYDSNFGDGESNINIGPQLTYLRALDVSELWSRVWPEKDQVYFSWAFQEFDFVQFPGNHVVEIPEFQARAIRTDNKPLYPPNQWEDNLTLGLLNAKYLFYWSPGPLGWNPANTTTNSNVYTTGFSVWRFEQGLPPLQTKFYAGKEAMALNATVKAAYNFSLIQEAADGVRYQPAFHFQRATKNGGVEASNQVEAIQDGSWFNASLVKRQPFAIVLENNGKRVVLFQDLWARPGRWTEFDFVLNGVEYRGKTQGNRLFMAKL